MKNYSFTPLPKKVMSNIEARIERIKIELKELRQDHESLKIEIERFLQSTFVKICNKIDELEKKYNGS